MRTATGKWALIVLFAAFISLPLCLSAFDIGRTSEEQMLSAERRKPAERPPTPSSSAALESFPEKFELWFDDAFGGRSPLLLMNARTKVRLFRTSPYPKNVILGKNGWLFLGPRWLNPVEQYRGVDKFSESELVAWTNSMRSRSEWLAARGVPMILVLAPGKHEIYPEMLPGWAREARRPKRVDQVAEILRDSTIHYVDPTDSLIAGKSTAPTYYATDSHWNSYGAFVAYKGTLDYLEEEFPHKVLRNLADEPYRLKEELGEGLRLSAMLGFSSDDFTDLSVDVMIPGVPAPVEMLDSSGRHVRNIRSGEIPTARTLVVRQPTFSNGAKVLVLRDSFTTSMSPFLSQSFGEAVYLSWDSPGGSEMTSFIERFQPDIVLFILCSRCLAMAQEIHANWARPDGLLPSERFHAQNEIQLSIDPSEVPDRLLAGGWSRPDGSDNEDLLTGAEVSSGRLSIKRLASEWQGSSMVRFDVSSPDDASFQLTYCSELSGGKREFQSHVSYLFAGRNSVFIELPETAFIVQMRIEVSGTSGKFTLHGWEVRKMREG